MSIQDLVQRLSSLLFGWYGIGIAGVFLVQASLIGFLLVERTRRRRIQTTLDERLRFEKLVSELSADFARKPAAQVDCAIDAWLHALSDSLGFQSETFFALPKGGTGAENAAKPAGVLRERVLRFADALERGEVVQAMPANGKQESTSLLAVPIEVGETVFVLALAGGRDHRGEIQDLVQRLSLVGQIFADAILRKRDEEALRNIASGVSATTGETFFRALASHLSAGLETDCAYICEVIDARRNRVRTLAACIDGEISENVEYDPEGTPCQTVLDAGRNVCVSGVQAAYPKDSALKQMGLESYLGVALSDSNGRPFGLICVASRKPLRNIKTAEAMLQIFAARASAEIERQKAERALREAEAKNRAIVSAIPDLLFLQDENGVYLDYYARDPGQLYAPPEAFLGKTMRDVLPSELCCAAEEKFREAADGGATSPLEYSLTIGGELRFYEIRVSKIGDKYLSIVRDITKRKQAERELKENKLFIERITDTVPSAVFLYDLQEHRLVYINRQVKAIFGYSDQEFLAMGNGFIERLAHPEDAPRMRKHFACYEGGADGQVFTFLWRARHKSGEWRWIRCQETIFSRTEDGRAKLTIGAATDITELKRVQDELQQLSSRLIDMQDEERRKIASELHDVTAQNLFAISLNLERLRQADSAPSKNEEIVAECQELCERSLREIRTLSYLLHPPALDKVGLVSTLRWYIDGFAKRSGIDVRLEAESIGRLPHEMEVDLFRVVQEGLANVVRHSGSAAATVRITTSDNQIVLEIRDYGRGVQRTASPSEAATAAWIGAGIPGLRERLRQFGGRLELKAVDPGAVLVATAPLPAEVSAKAAAVGNEKLS